VALTPHERYPLIIADPPYLPTDEIVRWPDDPVTAIDGGPDGLALARASLDVARRHLDPAGTMLLQLGSLDEADGVRRLAGPELEVCEIRQPDPAGVVVSVRRTGG
jgi:release factor glutamine methyltransferase